MSKFISCFLIALLSFGLVINEASAKRFGGGRSFGVQRSKSSLSSSPKPQHNTKATGQNASRSKWGGILGGLLVGGLLASLFMGNGLGSGLLAWLIVGSLVFFLISFLRKKRQPGFQSASSNAFGQNSFNNPANPNNQHFQASSFSPTGFDNESFLRDAKVKFIRLQTAYDQKNLQDLNEFTAPEVFAEIQMQLTELGDKPNMTEIISLNAELLDLSQQVDSIMASVRFTGSLKENGEQTSLDEIWHFRKFNNQSDWVVGGIQQEVL